MRVKPDMEQRRCPPRRNPQVLHALDYHVDVEGPYYSVPYVLVKQQLDVRVTAEVVELFHKNTRVASHRCSALKGRHSTVTAHMPTAPQPYAEWTPNGLSTGRPPVERPLRA